MKRKAASSNDTTMSPSTVSSVDKWERTNLRLPAVAPRNDDSLISSATKATSGSSLTADASNHNHSRASHDVDYLYLPPAIDSSTSSSVAIEENHEQHRSRVTTSKQKLLQHFKALDRHLSSIPQLTNSTRQLLVYNGGHENVTATNSGRIINVLQGEMAHCTPNQADVLVSDDATTCHILALWSVSKRNSCSHLMQQQQDQSIEQKKDQGKTILATIAHIDGPGYQDCIRDAVDLHYQHHSSQHHFMSSSQAELRDDDDEDTTVTTIPDIELYIHLMGGYNDNEGTSHEITEGVLRALSNISNDYANIQQQKQLQPRLQMILQTCAVSSSNDDGSRCPIGRGLALSVSSGQVYLAEVDEEEEDVAVVESSASSCRENNDHANDVAVTTSARGPDWILRHVRLWASLLFQEDDDTNTHQHKKRKLQIIHHPTKDQLIISPFYFDSSHPFPHQMLTVFNDEMFLQYTSSSPEVEKANFVSHVRETFRFMNERSCLDAFEKKEVKEIDSGGGSWNDDDYLPRRYRRVGLNGWAAVT